MPNSAASPDPDQPDANASDPADLERGAVPPDEESGTDPETSTSERAPLLDEFPEDPATSDESAETDQLADDTPPQTFFPGADSPYVEAIEPVLETDERSDIEGETPQDQLIKREEAFAAAFKNLERLDSLLAREFGDTLSGLNAYTGPLGVLLLILALLGWLLGPMLEFLHMGNLIGDQFWTVPAVAAVLSLAGLHLLFYWTVHRISNSVKSRELDRLIESRRVRHPCSYLNCHEPADDDLPPPEEILDGSDELHDGELLWRCDLFDVELEGRPLCAVCDRYEPKKGD